MPVKPIPDGYTAVTPYLIVDDALALIDFVQKVFGGELIFKLEMPGERKIAHAEMSISGAKIMCTNASLQFPALTGLIYVYVPDCDKTIEKAVANGATIVMPAATHFYGDRSGAVKDRNGVMWSIATHVEDVPPAELARRAAGMMNQKSNQCP